MGMAIIEGQAIVEKKSWLIRPPELYFDPWNVMIHGITEKDVKNKPEFNNHWEVFQKEFQGGPLIAHNASFDMSVLRYVLDEYELPYPEMNYYCTRVISKKTWPGLVSYSLDIVADHLGINFKHHDPQDDAVACAEIALRACHESGTQTIEALVREKEIITGKLFPGGYKPCGVKWKSWKISDITPTTDEINPNNPLYEKAVVFTGALQSMDRKTAIQKVVNCGGHGTNSISKKTDFLVMGQQDYSKFKDGMKSSKLKKAEALIKQGIDLEIISESEFLQLI
jgi:DNA polymerase-3 subunit epsilon